MPAFVELNSLGHRGWTGNDGRDSLLLFDLAVTDFHADWKGKMLVGWPPMERAWWRRAHRNTIPVLAILEESALQA